MAQSEAAKKKKKKPLSDDLNNFQVPSPTPGESRSGKSTRAGATAVIASDKQSTSASETDPKAVILKKLKSEPCTETESEFRTKVEIKIKMPEELKQWLVDDWDLIVRHKKLVNVEDAPSNFMTVDKILDEYLKAKTKGANKARESQVKDICDGIREYFNAMLGCQLVYKFERPQYTKLDKTLSDEIPMSSVYGVSHLVRLFVKLGQMLIYTDLNEADTSTLTGHLEDFLKFLVKSNHFSPSDYVTAPPDYVKKVQT